VLPCALVNHSVNRMAYDETTAWCYATVATSLVVLHWLCDSSRMGCARRTTPCIYVARTSNKRV